MLEEEDWLIPRQNGVVTLQKPPLYYWMMAASMTLTGDREELGARLPSATAGLLCLVLVWRLGTRWGRERAGWWAAFFLLANPLFWGQARTAEMDVVLAAIELAAVWAFMAARDGTGRPWGAWLGWLLVAAGFLVKGPVGVVVPAAVLLVYALADRRERKRVADGGGSFARGRDPVPSSARQWIRPGWGAVLFLALALPWFVYVLVRVPEAGAVFTKNTLVRYRGGLDHVEPFWFYVPVLLGGFLPATLYAPVWFRHAREKSSPSASHLRRLAVILVLLVLFFSLSGSKRVYYILPLWPLMAVGLGLALQEAGARGPTRWLRFPTVLLGAALALAALAVVWVPLRGGPAFFLPSGAAFALLGGVAGLGLAASVEAARRRWRAGLVLVALALGAGVVFVVEAVGPVSNAYRSRAAFAGEVARTIPPSEPLFMFRQDNFALPFYARRTAPDLRTHDALIRTLTRHDAVYLMLESRQAGELRDRGLSVRELLTSTWAPPGRRSVPRDLTLARVERSRVASGTPEPGGP
jgi:4-amino-4-deoxy-L-arabinose transferase-like glycosyltransferase